MTTPIFNWRVPTDNEGNKALSVRELATDVEATLSSTTVLFATSTSSRTIAKTTLYFTVEAGRSFLTGTPRIRISYRLDHSKFVEGKVLSYVGNQVQIEVDTIGGSGNYNDWIVGVAGEPGIGYDRITLPNLSSAPAAPTSGVVLFAQGNTLKAIVPGGNITTLAS